MLRIDSDSNIFPNIGYPMNDLNRRITAYSSTDDHFAFLRGSSESESERKMTNSYSKDLDSFGKVVEEWIQWRSLVNKLRLNKDIKATNARPSEMMAILKENNLKSSFPNVYIILRIYLTLSRTNCTGERSFNHLKRIKFALRSTMGLERLNSLTIMSFESEIVKFIDYSDLIDNFSILESRRRQF